MKTRRNAFTRVELMVSVVALVFLLVVASPLWGGSKGDSPRAGCFNNLRRMGQATQVWGNDHADRLPWITPVTEGGTQLVPPLGKTAVAWVEWITFTNELASPQVFVCPSDRATKVASHWGNTAYGFANSGFRANALSYFVSYHCQPDLPRSVITGDRDFRPSATTPGSCSRGPINVLPVFGSPFPVGNVAWTNEVHLGAGHLLFTDGSVEFVSSARLQAAFTGPGANDNVNIHFINAR